MSEKKNFLQTVPGVITGIATILTAVVALIPLFSGGGSEPEPQASQSASPTPSETATASQPATSGTSGTTRIAPRAVIAPKSINFGNVGSGRSDTQTVTIANSGNEYLVVESATISGREDVFSVQAEECLEESGIAPEDECEMTVTFAPTAPGSFAGFLEIEHTGSTSPERVALNGEAALLGL